MGTSRAQLDPATIAGSRARLRTSSENAATGLINAIVNAPESAAEALVQDVEKGAEPQAILALLEAAAKLARFRGVRIDPFVRAMRARLLPQGTPVAGAKPAGRQWKGVPSWLRALLPGR